MSRAWIVIIFRKSLFLCIPANLRLKPTKNKNKKNPKFECRSSKQIQMTKIQRSLHISDLSIALRTGFGSLNLWTLDRSQGQAQSGTGLTFGFHVRIIGNRNTGFLWSQEGRYFDRNDSKGIGMTARVGYIPPLEPGWQPTVYHTSVSLWLCGFIRNPYQTWKHLTKCPPLLSSNSGTRSLHSDVA